MTCCCQILAIILVFFNRLRSLWRTLNLRFGDIEQYRMVLGLL